MAERRRTGISRQQRRNQLRVGLNNLATSSTSLGAKDPRWRRNANKGATSQNYGNGLELRDQVLEVDSETLKGVVKSAKSPAVVDANGSLSISLGNALETVKGELAVKKVPAIQDSTATDAAGNQAAHNALLEELRKAGFLAR